MHFAFVEDQQLLRSTTRKFIESRHPIAATRSHIEDDSTLDRDIWREGAALGWTAMLIPEEHEGGSITAQPVVDLVSLAEELGRQLSVSARRTSSQTSSRGPGRGATQGTCLR